MNAFMPPTHQLQSTCVQEGSRVPNLQTEFNYLDSFKSYCNFSDFIVPTWSPWSPHHPCLPHIIPVVPILSPKPPEGPHVVPMAMVSVVFMVSNPMLSSLSLWSPHCPHHPHVIPVVSMSSLHCLEGPHIIPNPSDTHSTHPPPPGGVGALNQ